MSLGEIRCNSSLLSLKINAAGTLVLSSELEIRVYAGSLTSCNLCKNNCLIPSVYYVCHLSEM